ncbi:MAG: S41 family peptidase [Betaproteobacteria bacterium]|nr:S41 family peptidase [Betaproteobacteria bacterium]
MAKSIGGRGWLVTLVFLLLSTGLVGGILLDRGVLADAIPDGQIPATAQADFGLMANAWNIIREHYVARATISRREMTYGAISGMVNALGDTDHSTFLSPKMLHLEHDSLEGQFAGIGAKVQMKNNQVVVVAPMDGTPAQKAGLKPGDIILKVSGKDVSGLTLQQVVERITGPAGTKVTLTLRAPKTDRIRTVTLTRARITVPSVSWAMLAGTSIADVRVATFSKHTSRDLENALAAARRHGATKLILDLRSNPGGFLTQAVDVASQFLPSGNVVLERDAAGKVTPIAVVADVPKTDFPMVVMVDNGTASAAEIVAGALQDSHRAVLVGEKTFGTGTVLREFKLPDGSAILLAVEEWLTPLGHSIWHRGISPNKTVALAQDALPDLPDNLAHMNAHAWRASSDAQLLQAVRILQRPLPKAAPKRHPAQPLKQAAAALPDRAALALDPSLSAGIGRPARRRLI